MSRFHAPVLVLLSFKFIVGMILLLPISCESKKQDDSEGSSESEVMKPTRDIEVKIREDADVYSIDLFPKDVDLAGFQLSVTEKPESGKTEVVNADKGTLEFNPAKNFNGKVEIKAEIRKQETLLQSVKISVIVSPMPDDPIVRGQSVRLDEGQSLDVTLEISDADDEKLELKAINAGTVGDVTIVDAAKGMIRYVGKRQASGRDEISFVATDESGKESQPAKVIFLVGAVNDRPIGSAVLSCITESRAEPLSLDAVDSDSPTLTYALDSKTKPALAYGRIAVFSATGVATYLPQAGFLGWDRYYFTATDGSETSDPTPVTVVTYREQFTANVGAALQGPLLPLPAKDLTLGDKPAFKFEPVANRFGTFTINDAALPTFSFTPNDAALTETQSKGYTEISFRASIGAIQRTCPVKIVVSAAI